MVTRILGRKADRMGDHSSRPDRPTPGGSGANETTWVFSDPEPAAERPVTGPPPSGSQPPIEAFRPQTEAAFYPQTEASFQPQAEPAFHPQTEAAFRPQTEVAQHPRTGGARPAPPTDFVWYGPGVPMTPKPRLRRALGTAFTVLLLAVAAVILFLRFHHAPFAVTGAAITQQTRNGCSVDVTGKIVTSGGAGTLSYQWVFRPDSRPPQPLTQTVIAGQKSVFVTVAVEGSGQGSASQSVTLQVLGPDKKSATTAVVIRC
jgi:hypothetical protein